MTIRLDQYRAGYIANWNKLTVRPQRLNEVRATLTRGLKDKAIYQKCEDVTNVPWWFIMLVNYREDDFNINDYLGNGQSLYRQTTMVPAHRGPFKDFVAGAVDAMKLQGYTTASDWSIAPVAYRFEGMNGFGYRQFGVNSPYLYGGSTLYGPPEAKAGKYVADGPRGWRSNVIDTQLGTLTLLKQLTLMDSSITLGAPAVPSDELTTEDHIAHGTLWVQQVLNRLRKSTDPVLVEDGILGRATMRSLRLFQALHNLKGTGLPDAETLAALQTAIAPPEGPHVPSLPERIVQALHSIFHV